MSKYFDTDEITCNCGCGQGLDIVNPILLENLDKLREAYGKPIYTSCMYRCPQHNAEVGGVYNSQHVLGNAADVFVSGDLQELLRLFALAQSLNLFDGIGVYYNDEFLHLDVRDNGKSPNYYYWEG